MYLVHWTSSSVFVSPYTLSVENSKPKNDSSRDNEDQTTNPCHHEEMGYRIIDVLHDNGDISKIHLDFKGDLVKKLKTYIFFFRSLR